MVLPADVHNLALALHMERFQAFCVSGEYGPCFTGVKKNETRVKQGSDIPESLCATHNPADYETNDIIINETNLSLFTLRPSTPTGYEM